MVRSIIRFLLPAVSIIVFAWIYKGEGDSWLYSFFYGCFVTFALLLPSYIRLGIKGYVCYGLVLLGTLALFLSLVKGVPVANAVGYSALFALLGTAVQYFLQNIVRLSISDVK